MKRITIVSLFSVCLALAAGTGCSAQTGHGTDESGPSTADSQMVGVEGDGNPNGGLPPTQMLELNVHHLTDDGQGPHPEPWLDRLGPHPEPWQGKTAMKVPDPDAHPHSANDSQTP